VPTGAQWAYEIKHDGFRFICRWDIWDIASALARELNFPVIVP